jgi:hypothetical protein
MEFDGGQSKVLIVATLSGPIHVPTMLDSMDEDNLIVL